MPTRPRDLHQYRYIADRIVGACRLQRDRCLSPDAVTPHDIDLYLICVDRLRELARKVRDKLQLAGARELLETFERRLPEVEALRNFAMHPAESDRLVGWISWFSNSIVRLEPGGGVQYLLDAEFHHEYVEELYDGLCSLLGSLPDGAS